MSAELVLVAPEAASGPLIPLTTGRNVAIKPKPSRKRNAGGNRRAPARRVRNASGDSSKSRAAPEANKSEEERSNEQFTKVVQPHRVKQSFMTALSSVLSSAAGVGLCRLGIPPVWSSVAVAGAGVLANSYVQGDTWRSAATGATGAGSSQLGLQLLQWMFPALVQRQPVVVVQQPHVAAAPPALPAPAPAPTRPRGADVEIEALKPGSLDAAFERARAELAVEANGFPEGFAPNQHTRLATYHEVANDNHLHEPTAHQPANDNYWHIDGEPHAVTR